MCLDSFASRARLQKTKLLQKATFESAFENVCLDDRFCSLGRYARGEGGGGGGGVFGDCFFLALEPLQEVGACSVRFACMVVSLDDSVCVCEHVCTHVRACVCAARGLDVSHLRGRCGKTERLSLFL